MLVEPTLTQQKLMLTMMLTSPRTPPKTNKHKP